MPRFPKLLPMASILAVLLVLSSGCGDDDDPTPRDFTLRFQAVDGGTTIGCGTVMSGFGSDGESTVEVSDLRFYVSNLRFFDASGDPVTIDLDENDFQYSSPEGSVALLDLTGTVAGACGTAELEGTARTNGIITGTYTGNDVTRVTFDVGVPQAVMKKVIANNTAEGAPSPLAEMHWSWAGAYRHLVMNFAIVDGEGVGGEGFVHVGSTGCGGDGTKALTDRDECNRINAPAVSLASFDLESDVVALDVRELLEGIALKDGNNAPGCGCHSFTTQADCAGIFSNLGLTLATGASNAALDEVFKVK
ncbi:MAG TPA: MbnP family copper-binding protein [Candidatus Eisenbacteria bacterium]